MEVSVMDERQSFRKVILTAIAALLAFVATLQARGGSQVEEEWVERYDGPGSLLDAAYGMVMDPSGNIVVTGESSDVGGDKDYATIAYDPDGQVLWAARYDGPGDFGDMACAIALDRSSGNILVTGTGSHPVTGWDIVTVAYDSTGNELWVSRWADPGISEDKAAALAVDDSGNVYVTGTTLSMARHPHDSAVIIAYDRLGNERWVARHDGSGFPVWGPHSIVTGAPGNVYVSGMGGPNGYTESFILAYDSIGNQLWSKEYGRYGDGLIDTLAVDAVGNLYATGTSRGSPASGYDFWTISYDPSGNERWEARYAGPGDNFDNAASIAVDSAGDIHVTGTTSFGAPSGLIAVKYDSSGNERWAAVREGSGEFGCADPRIAVDVFGNAYVTASSDCGVPHDLDYRTFAWDSSGRELWEMTYNGPGNSGDVGNAIVADSLGNVYVTGVSMGQGTGYDFATVKYSWSTIADDEDEDGDEQADEGGDSVLDNLPRWRSSSSSLSRQRPVDDLRQRPVR
jgi:hypothetical protein